MVRSKSDAPKDSASPNDLSEVELRFVDEFLVDRDPHAAALRTGVSRIQLKKKVQAWMSDQRILKTIQLKTDSTDLEKMISPQRIVAGFIDVAFDRNAPPAARNTALKELAALKKMYGDDGDKPGSGVVLIPVVGGSTEEWKALAMAAQQKLKDEVRG